MKNWLYGKTVVLTGASGGIGRELTKLLIEKYGASVIGIGRDESKMRSLAAELAQDDFATRYGDGASRFSWRLFDVSDEDAWKRFAQELESERIRPALLVNNAGAFPSFRRAEDQSSETVERILKINFLGTVYAMNAISPLLAGDEKNKPAIVNISSSAALCTVVGTSAYSASKAALKAYTEARQMENKNEYVGVVYPGTTKTELFRDDKNTENSALDLIAMPAEKMAKKIARRILKKRKRSVVGWDAKCMHLVAKLAPVKGLALIAWVMKISKSKVFSKVFDHEKK